MTLSWDSKKAFTLLELIIVIVIIGVLATLGYSQYNRVVEKGRMAEAVAGIGLMRKNAIAYYMVYGAFTNITATDLGIGLDLPSTCTGTNYFWYQTDTHSDSSVQLDAERCTSGGKTPNYGATYEVYTTYNSNGTINPDPLQCWRSDGSGVVPCPPYP